MIYWSLVVLSLLTCAFCGTNAKKYKERKIVFLVFGIILVYLSSFRMGLGMDYSGYLDKIYWENYSGLVNWLDEPLFTLLSLLIEKTAFTPVLLFSVFSILTIVGLLSFYGRKDNIYWLSSIVIFTLMPILFFNSFNLVRQFSAAGLFFYSIRYIEQRRIVPFSICIIIAAACHLTAILLFPLFFVIKRKYSSLFIVAFLVLSFILSSTFLRPLVEGLALFDDKYSIYLDSKQQMQTSGMILLYNVMGGWMLIIKDKFSSTVDIISYNLFFLLILFSNLSFVNFYYFRIAVYFSPVFAYVFPKLVSETIGYKYSGAASWLFGLLFFITFILNGMGNPIIVPDGILPFSALWDESQYKVVYNINRL